MKFKSNDYLDTPHGNTTVWRYMGLDKFLDLLTQQRIYFTNARNFTDGYEVSFPQNIVRRKRKELKQEGLTGRDLEEELAVFEWNHQPMRDLTLVNCWSIGRHESYALWKIYLAGSKAGIAVRTNISRLKRAIEKGNNSYPEDIYIGKVKYTDYLPEDSLSRFHLITTKREFYEYEKEVRLFILHYPRSEGGEKPPYDHGAGRYVGVNVETLIDQIYLSPFVGQWFEESIKSLLENISPKLKDRIVTSAIIDQ